VTETYYLMHMILAGTFIVSWETAVDARRWAVEALAQVPDVGPADLQDLDRWMASGQLPVCWVSKARVCSPWTEESTMPILYMLRIT
jgi:hypothetical protein